MFFNVSMAEKIDVRNILEIQKIQELLVNHPDLLSMLTIVCVMCNDRLNHEKKPLTDPPIEPHTEPNLSDHESDDD